jgi:hypothetical protein
MNFLNQILTNHVDKLERDTKTMEKVGEWVETRRDILDRFGPCLTTADGEYMDVVHFEDLESILGTDQTEE